MESGNAKALDSNIVELYHSLKVAEYLKIPDLRELGLADISHIPVPFYPPK
ncbi:MAG: hypothetical protein VKL59_06920 [Nostocaceae cyanobacterium]|nr:hypothetical protein [Nostocaceae cyanobacterium]